MHGRNSTYGNVSPKFHQRNTTAKALRFPATYIPIGGEQTLPIVSEKIAAAGNGAPPEKAAPFLREPFYPHLTSLILENEVPRGLQKRLDNFRATRDAAATTVFQKIVELEKLPADEASVSWAAFEEQEAATWEKIETERADLLDRLQSGGVWARGVKLIDIRELVLSSETDYRTVPLIDLGTLRHFTTGLSMDQRDLIGEFQLELTEPDTAEGANRSVLISATGNRIALPKELTSDQSQALQSYTQTKAELKQEILTTMLPVLRNAFYVSEVERTAARLNEIQTPKFERMAAELEALTTALNEPANDSPQNTAHLIGPESSIDLEAFAMLSGTQRRLLAYSSVNH